MADLMRASRSTFAAVLAFALTVACSSDPEPCDNGGCAAGNKCLAFNGETKCRKTCGSNSNPATSCPFGYTCTDTQSGVEPFCVQDKAVKGDGTPLTKKPSGQWGSKCPANLGAEQANCDGDQGFFCYGISPTDGDAYCTRYDCKSDDECGAGFWCATVNRTPNILNTRRKTLGETQTVCLRRTYCATCKADVDCPDIAGKRQHCLLDASGAAACMPECDSNQACPNEARCMAYDGVDAQICYPRSNVCVGDGSLCSSCRSDADCGTDGICVKGEYTTEKSCAKKSSGDCSACPKKSSNGKPIGCSKDGSDILPAKYCVGLYYIGPDPSDLGCWTPNR
jgi:hypothetical protein